jgi:hypothetical protein
MAGLLVPSATALVLPSAVPSLVAPAAASELQAAAAALNEPGVKLTYDGPIMDYDGSLRYPISGAEIVSPSGVLLLFGALATRCGGLLPDEMPFNLVQKVLRAVPGLQALVPDYADDDYRKQFQDNWYGTSTKADLPDWLRSRPSTNVLTRTSPPDAVAEPESLPTPGPPEGEGGEERT